MLRLVTEWPGRIAKLYWMDPELRNLSPEERRTAQHCGICPVVEDPHRFLDATLWQISRKSTFAETIGYALTRKEGGTRFLDAGRIKLGSNFVGLSIHPLASETQYPSGSPHDAHRVDPHEHINAKGGCTFAVAEHRD